MDWRAATHVVVLPQLSRMRPRWLPSSQIVGYIEALRLREDGLQRSALGKEKALLIKESLASRLRRLDGCLHETEVSGRGALTKKLIVNTETIREFTSWISC